MKYEFTTEVICWLLTTFMRSYGILNANNALTAMWNEFLSSRCLNHCSLTTVAAAVSSSSSLFYAHMATNAETYIESMAKTETHRWEPAIITLSLSICIVFHFNVKCDDNQLKLHTRARTHCKLCGSRVHVRFVASLCFSLSSAS